MCQPNTYNIALNDEHSAWSDIIVPSFGSIPILVLNHARLTNIRVGEFVLYMTYTGVTITAAELTYSFFNGFSGEMLYGSTIHFLYSYIFVGLYGAILYTTKIDI